MKTIAWAWTLPLAVLTVVSLVPMPAGAQGLSEMGAAYGASAGLSAGLHASGVQKAPGGAMNALTNQLNSVSGAADGGTPAPSGGGRARRANGRKPHVVAEKLDENGDPIVPDPRMTVIQIGKRSNMLYDQGVAKWKAGKLDEADKLLKQSCWMRENVWGLSDPAVPKIYNLLGQIALKNHKPEDAEADFRKALTSSLKKYALGSYELTNDLYWLGEAFNAEKKYSDAANYYQQVYQLRQRKLGDSDKETIAAAVKLANSWANSDNLSDAEDLLKKNTEAAEKVTDDKQPLILVLDSYSKVLKQRNKNAEAEKVSSRLQELQGPAAPAAAPADGKTADKASDSKAADSKTGDLKAADSKATDLKAADSKAGNSKGADPKAASEGSGKPDKVDATKSAHDSSNKSSD